MGDDHVAIWGAYLLKSISSELTDSERSEIDQLLLIRPVDARAVLAAYRGAGVAATAALDALDQRLAAQDRWLFVAYDELDTIVLEDWETMGVAIRGLVSFWAAYARRWRRLRPKIFLRSDFYKHHRDVAGADVAKLAGNRVELQWSVSGARPPGASNEEVLENLVELGVLRARSNDLYDVPDLYLQGLDLRRKGGVAKR